MNSPTLKIYATLSSFGLVGIFVLLVLGHFGLASYFATGCAVGLINLRLLQYSWDRILQKKDVVLAVLIIVSKYAIFGLIIYFLVSNSEKLGSMGENLAFMAGVGSVLLAIAVFNQQVKRTFEMSQETASHGAAETVETV